MYFVKIGPNFVGSTLTRGNVHIQNHADLRAELNGVVFCVTHRAHKANLVS